MSPQGAVKADVKLSEIIAPQFYDVHKSVRDNLHSEYWLKGGRGSTKSSFVALEIILGIINDETANSIVLRKYAKTIRDSVHATLLWAIDALGETENFDSKVSPTEIIYKPTGQKILMRGLDEPKKLKSIKIRKGYLKFLWFEEGEEYGGIEEIRSVEQSVLRGGEKFVEFFTFNPPKNPKHWINKEVKIKDKERLIHHSSYLEVPKEWLGAKFIQQAERLKKNNYPAYQHEYLGIPIGNPEEIIFSGKYEERDFETPALDLLYQSRFFYGADWGFAADPTCLIRCYILDDCLWIDKEIYGYQVELDDIPALFEKIPESKKWKIKADCSRPETISHIKNKGFNIEGASKWENSVVEGIEYLKTFKKIYIHTSCQKVLEEFDNYAYKVDKNTQEILSVVDDKAGWDHGIDAIRYALVDYIQKEISILDVL